MTDTQPPPPTPPPTGPTGPAGFGGWLLLPAFGTIISPWFYFKGGFDVFTTAFGPHMAKASVLLQAFVWLEGVANVGMLAAWIYAIVAMVTKRASYPRLYRNLALASFGFVLADLFVSGAFFGVAFTADDGLTIVRQVIVLVVWVPYMAASVRVRNTFVR